MENIAAKIRALNFPDDKLVFLNKFLVDLSDDIISLEEEVQILNYLTEKGITLGPSHIKIFASGLEFIQKQVEGMEKLGELDAYIEDPSRINSKEAIERLKYLQAIDEKYRSPEGKYAKTIFSKKAFEEQYGPLDLALEALEKKRKQNSNKEEKITDSAPALEPEREEKLAVEDSKKEPKKDNADKNHDSKKGEARKEPEKKDKKPEDDGIILTGEINLAELEKEFNSDNDTDKKDKKEAKEEFMDTAALDLTSSIVTDAFANPFEEILQKDQTIGLNDETFDRYERLADNIRHVLVSVYNIDEVNEVITDNLIKLITGGVENDRDVIYYAITYGKTISEEEKQRLQSAIEEELEYTNILDVDLGRVA